jgi:GNAT superfamily N-acetyltransferase
VNVRIDLRPGDIGRIIALHGELYAAQCGWDWTFEAYAGRTFAEWAARHDPVRDRIWIVEQEADIVGCIAIINAGGDVAQLRWFLLHPDLRGRGLGRDLVGRALAFCRECGYQRVILWTAASLTAATQLYRSFGFELTARETGESWGTTVTQEHYELRLT